MKQCNQCGKCCIKYSNGGLSASTDEIAWWDSFRPDIHRYVVDDKIWFDPETEQRLEYCPWLRKSTNSNVYTCAIYYDRPNDCKYYPVTIDQMIEDACEMLEPKDLIDPNKAQVTLDDIMANSRPACHKSK